MNGLKRRPPFDTIKQKLTEASQGRYTFNLNVYENDSQKIECKCSKCGYEWSASAGTLIRTKSGCRVCAMSDVGDQKRLPLNEAKQRLIETSQGRYSFELTDYKNSSQRVECKCNKCGYEWSAEFSSLVLQKRGCPKCAGVLRLSMSVVCSRLKGASRGMYSFVLPDGYKNNQSKVLCKCNKCGVTWLSSYDKLVYSGSGCPNRCYKTPQYISTPEHEITDYIKQSFPQLEVKQSVRSLIKNTHTGKALEIDIYIPQLNLAFEFNGTYWHSDESIKKRFKDTFENAQQYHDYKTQQCALKGVKLVHIDEQSYIDNKQNALDYVLKICCYRAVALNIDTAQFKKQVV